MVHPVRCSSIIVIEVIQRLPNQSTGGVCKWRLVGDSEGVRHHGLMRVPQMHFTLYIRKQKLLYVSRCRYMPVPVRVKNRPLRFPRFGGCRSNVHVQSHPLPDHQTFPYTVSFVLIRLFQIRYSPRRRDVNHHLSSATAGARCRVHQKQNPFA
jgi:hypothetical protein